MPAAKLSLYELAGADRELRFSPHCWKTRMALAHKGLNVELLEPDDPVFFWRERLLDLFDGLARRARSVQR